MSRNDYRLMGGIGLVAAAIAFASARPHAGSWNDGSRLAAVESLVDRGTWRIDDSIFVAVPPLEPQRPSPYPHDDQLLQTSGTKDKLFIDGHYYSDKSPTPAVYLAGVYRLARSFGMLSAAKRPDLFCLLMTLASSGLAYVIAVVALVCIARRLGLDARWSALLALFFAVGTVALPYAQYVNNHILLLAVALLVFQMLLIGEKDGWTTRRAIAVGTLAGIAYTIDLGAGPPLFVLVLAFGSRRLPLLVAALPWIVLHHALNYQIGGSLMPANANPAYFNWPGSPFSEQNMTGALKHSSPVAAAVYALDMLFGKKGYFGHNLILFVPLLALPRLLGKAYPERRVVVLGMLWAAGTWLLYAVTSNNLSGGCCSIRWFVPLLAPGLVALCVLLRDHPAWRLDALITGVGGLLLGIGMATRGPWFQRIMPFYWYLYFGTLAVWFAFRWRLRARPQSTIPPVVLSIRVDRPASEHAEVDVLRPNPAPVATNNP